MDTRIIYSMRNKIARKNLKIEQLRNRIRELNEKIDELTQKTTNNESEVM